jgi:hypothetical protein
MLMMSIWIQDKLAGVELLSNALFCVWLSMASLIPSFVLGVM